MDPPHLTMIEVARSYWTDPERFLGLRPHPWVFWSLGTAANSGISQTRTRLGSPGRAVSGEPILFPVRRRGNPGSSFDQGVTLGRADTNDIVVSNALVSRFHACFQEIDGAWFLVDADSKNGTWLNGVALLPSHKSPLGVEAAISLGGLQVQFFLSERLAAYLSGPVQSAPSFDSEE